MKLKVINRKCGACSACCTALGVPSIGKANGEPCRHQSPSGGCGVYDTRPPECGAFRCAWHLGELAESDRPDRLGLMFWHDINSKPAQMFGPGKFLVGHEVRPGAADEGHARHVLHTMSLSRVVYVRHADGRRTGFGPPPMLAAMKGITGQ